MTRAVIYSMSVSLDCFIADPGGDIGWTAPDEELFRFHVQLTRDFGAQLLGRRPYEETRVWETAETSVSGADRPIWRAIPASSSQVSARLRPSCTARPRRPGPGRGL